MVTQNQFNYKDVSPVGTWDSNAKFEVQGKQFEMLYNFSQMLQNLPWLLNDLYQKALQAGVIKIQYLYPDGSEASAEHIGQFQVAMEAMQNRFAGQSKPTQAPSLVDTTGAPIQIKQTETVMQETSKESGNVSTLAEQQKN